MLLPAAEGEERGANAEGDDGKERGANAEGDDGKERSADAEGDLELDVNRAVATVNDLLELSNQLERFDDSLNIELAAAQHETATHDTHADIPDFAASALSLAVDATALVAAAVLADCQASMSRLFTPEWLDEVNGQRFVETVVTTIRDWHGDVSVWLDPFFVPRFMRHCLDGLLDSYVRRLAVHEAEVAAAAAAAAAALRTPGTAAMRRARSFFTTPSAAPCLQEHRNAADDNENEASGRAPRDAAAATRRTLSFFETPRKPSRQGDITETGGAGGRGVGGGGRGGGDAVPIEEGKGAAGDVEKQERREGGGVGAEEWETKEDSDAAGRTDGNETAVEAEAGASAGSGSPSRNSEAARVAARVAARIEQDALAIGLFFSSYSSTLMLSVLPTPYADDKRLELEGVAAEVSMLLGPLLLAARAMRDGRAAGEGRLRGPDVVLQ